MDVPTLWSDLGAMLGLVLASQEPKRQLALTHLHPVFRAAGVHGPALLGSLLSSIVSVTCIHGCRFSPPTPTQNASTPDLVAQLLAGEQWSALGLASAALVAQFLQDHVR